MRWHGFAGAAAILAATLTLVPVTSAGGGGSDARPRIVGGTPVAAGTYPWMTALTERRDPLAVGPICGGTLIGTQTVLTAAHCLHELDASRLDAAVGAVRLKDEGGERIAVERFSNAGGAVDLALLRLAEPATVAPVAIAGPADAPYYAPGAPARVLGWGQLSEDKLRPSNNLREVEVPIVSDADCAAVHRKFDPAFKRRTSICAGAPGRDACNGDSGGPLLVADGAGALKQVGVVSYGRGCGRKSFFGVYVELPAVLDFVLDPDPTWAPSNERGRAKIAGRPRVGEQLRCVDGRWQGREVEMRWYWSRVAGTGFLSRRPRLDVGSKLAGKRVFCAVVATNPGGSASLQSGLVRIKGGGP